MENEKIDSINEINSLKRLLAKKSKLGSTSKLEKLDSDPESKLY